MPIPTSPTRRRMKPAHLMIICAGLFLVFGTALNLLQPASPVKAAPPEPTDLPQPGLMPAIWMARLAKPVLPANPTLADKGSIPYWSICLSCHGDKGQGLTDEWRRDGFGEDMNCWQSKCHASNHPTPGFAFPHQVPPVIGPNTLLRFTNALELKNYIKTAMPWWDPGSLSEQDAWNLTAYLLRENGVLPRNVDFNPKDAASTPVHLAVRPRQVEYAWQFLLAALLGFSALALVAARFTKIAPSGVAQAGNPRPNFMHHLHPPTIPAPQARWRYTLGAGGLAIFLFLVIAFTGILEMFFYIPTPEKAGISIQAITFLVPYGGLVRGLHFWAAQALVVVTGIHLLRVVFTGAYSRPRRFNFLLGMGLFVLIFLMNFTGYILRWDDGIHWALIVGTNLLKSIPAIGTGLYGFIVGGPAPGLATLTRFYAWHIFGLTLVAIIFLGWHIFRVRRDGGIAAPPPEFRTDPSRISRFELVRREVLAMILSSVVLIMIATLIPPPLAAPIREVSMPLNPEVQAPWFFLWVQQLLRFGDAFWMGVFIPGLVLITMSFLPYLLPALPPEQKGRWFPRAGRVAQILISGLALAWLTLTLLELLK